MVFLRTFKLNFFYLEIVLFPHSTILRSLGEGLLHATGRRHVLLGVVVGFAAW